MTAALKGCDKNWNDEEEQEGSPQTNATFTEIYELISCNKTMVGSEWVLLLQLIRQKHMEKSCKMISNCCVCKKIRVDDKGSDKDDWMEVENFLKEEIGILLSSTYCPKCAQTVQEDLAVQIDRLKA